MSELSPVDARTLTDRIKVGVEAVWDLITTAYIERAWESLGYSSWDDYCTREFGTSRLRLPREERSEVVASLRESGLSIRAIAAATGNGVATVKRELDSGVPNGTPESPCPITGTDGKTYTPKPTGRDDGPELDAPLPEIAPAFTVDQLEELNSDPKEVSPVAPRPRQRPLEEGFFNATDRLNGAVASLKKLGADDRLPRNKEKVARYRNDLLQAIDALQRVADQLA